MAVPANRLSPEEQLTHVRQGPLGPTAVVPDGYVGPSPPNAISESDYQHMLAVYGDIESGKSSLRFNTTNFFMKEGQQLDPVADPEDYANAVGDADAFKQQYLGYMQELVKTPAGLKMLDQLDHSKFSTVISQNLGEGNNLTTADDNVHAHLDDVHGHQPSAGSGSRVQVDPSATAWGDLCGPHEPWMVERPKFGFYHELVHAYHNTLGDAEVWGGYQRAGCGPEADHDPLAMPIGNVEWQAAGLGPWANASVSENAIRAQMGVATRPSYTGRTYEAPAAQVHDNDVPPRVSHPYAAE